VFRIRQGPDFGWMGRLGCKGVAPCAGLLASLSWRRGQGRRALGGAYIYMSLCVDVVQRDVTHRAGFGSKRR